MYVGEKECHKRIPTKRTSIQHPEQSSCGKNVTQVHSSAHSKPQAKNTHYAFYSAEQIPCCRHVKSQLQKNKTCKPPEQASNNFPLAEMSQAHCSNQGPLTNPTCRTNFLWQNGHKSTLNKIAPTHLNPQSKLLAAEMSKVHLISTLNKIQNKFHPCRTTFSHQKCHKSAPNKLHNTNLNLQNSLL